MKFFISAATKGLGSYRQEVANALRRQGHEGFHQKEITADYQTIKAVLQNEMRQCDAVLCMVGPAFGFPCPPAEPHAPRKSYTQFEYELATQSLHKPTFLFFVTRGAELDRFEEENQDDIANQAQFCQRIRAEAESSGRWCYEVRNCLEVLAVLSECIKKAGGDAGDFWTAKLRSYPLPLVRAWEFIKDKRATLLEMHKTAESALTLLGLLALQDAALSTGTVPRLPDDQQSRKPKRWTEWLPLIKNSVPYGRFFQELPDWLKANEVTLRDLKGTLDRWAEEDEDEEALRVQAGELLGRLFASLQWLEHYVLAEVATVSEREATVRLLRGETATLLPLALVGDAPLSAEGRLYFLSLKRRQAVSLWPALWCYPCGYEFQPVQVASLITDASKVMLRLRSIAFGGPPDETVSCGGERLRWQAFPPAWLQVEALHQHAPAGTKGDAQAAVCRLLTEAAWKMLDEAIRPAEERRRVLAQHTLEQEPLHKGTRTDVYASEPEGQTRDRFAFYVLPDRLLNDQEAKALARADLQHRHECWLKLASHPAVLRPLPESDTRREAEIPFIVTPLLSDREPLDSWLRGITPAGGRVLRDHEVIALLLVAAEVCAVADAAGLRLLELPLRHFLCDPGTAGLCDATRKLSVCLTGFDTLFPAAPKDWPGDETPGAFLQRCTRDAYFAPELRRLTRRIPPSADIYALGQLLLQLRAVPPFSPSQGHLPLKRWHDPWECLAFHCTAADPGLRFQSAEHLLAVLREGNWLQGSPSCAPATVPVPGGEVRLPFCNAKVGDFHMGVYPVTNYEYGLFQEGRHREPYREDPRREAGPWCPVSGVSLDDAAAYCHWLHTQHGGRWRLPTESEWLRAAALNESRIYPWGNEEPDPTRANFERYFGGPSIVGTCAAGTSAAGCLDLAGNVWEWCLDYLHPTEPLRLLKGGAYDFTPDSLRLATRRGVVRSHRSPHVGFRVVREET